MERRGSRRRASAAIVRATCPRCGDVELAAAELRGSVCLTDGRATYAFDCPDCLDVVVKPAEQDVIDLLASAGVTVSRWERPAELAEVRQGPALTHDDLLRFHYVLESDDWFDAVRAMVNGSQA